MEEKNLILARQLRRNLHAQPELSNNEIWTKKELIRFLQTHTALEIQDMGKWFYAIHRSKNSRGRKAIAFRADFDAVAIAETISLPYGSRNPGISHKCGHDGHSAVLCGLILETCSKQYSRDLYFIFQHAEETGNGAEECLKDLPVANIGEIYAFHNMPGYKTGAVAIKEGVMHCASKGLRISLTGKPAHASMPETGVNPAHAIAAIIQALTPAALLNAEKYQYRGLVLCTVIQIQLGEEHFGISPGEGKILLTCRAQYEEDLNKLIANICQLCLKKASENSLACNFSYSDAFPETRNHKMPVDAVTSVCNRLNIPVVFMKEPLRASEDFGHFLKKTPGAMFFIGAGDIPQLHTEGYDFPDEIIEPAVEIFKGIIDKREEN